MAEESKVSPSGAEIARQVDLRGQICPYTLIETRDALKQLATGQVLEVISDYEPAVKTTIPNFCGKKGYPVDVAEEGENLWRLLITKTD